METWRAIPGYEGRYEVSDQGRVRSLRFRNWLVDMPRREPLLMRPSTSRAGYRRLTLYDGERARLRAVHQLVMAAFGVPCPPGYQCAHLNGCSTDNRFENLRWVTPKENQAHRYEHGTILYGDQNPARLYPERLRRGEQASTPKLTTAAVLEIRDAYESGREGVMALSRRFGVRRQAIRDVVRYVTWAHVGPGKTSTSGYRTR